MRAQVGCVSGRSTRMILLALVLAFPVVGMAEANVVTSGQYTLNGEGGVSLTVAFASNNGHKILQQNGNHLFMPGQTSLTYTVTAKTSASFPIVNFITQGMHGFPGTYTTIANGDSFTVTADLLSQDIIAHFLDSSGGGTGATVAINMFSQAPQFQVLTRLPGGVEGYGNGYPPVALNTAMDLFNTTFNVHAVKATPRGPGINDPAKGAQVMALYDNSDQSGEHIEWKSDWVVTDDNGDATVTMGSGGGQPMAVEAGVRVPELY